MEWRMRTELTYWVFGSSLYIVELTVEEDAIPYSEKEFQNFVPATFANRQFCLTLHLFGTSCLYTWPVQLFHIQFKTAKIT